MFLKQFNPRTPTLRHLKKTIIPNSLNYFNHFQLYKPNLAGRSSQGQIIMYSKGSRQSNVMNNYDKKRMWTTKLGVVLNAKKTKLGSLLGLLKYSNGSLSTLKLVYGLNLGMFLKTTNIPLSVYPVNVLGFRVFLSQLRNNMVFSTLSVHNRLSALITANGTYGSILNVNLDLNIALLLLPSKAHQYFPTSMACTIGRNNNIFHKFIIQGGAGLNRRLGNKGIVRGVAKNAVDHPHGGRTKTNQPEVSPWG